MKKEKAFTLIELLVVIAIISLISSIVLVLLKEPRERARIAKVLPFAQSIHSLLGANAVGIWNFNGNLQDASGNNNHGTFFGEATIPFTDDTPNKALGQALSFDGVDDYVDCGSGASLNITGTISMELWFNTNTLSLPKRHRMMFTGYTSSYLSLITSGSANPFLSLNIGGTQRTLSSGLAPSINTWYHVVGTWDGDRMRIYVNGALKNTSISYSGALNFNSTKYIGRYSSSGYEFSGLIDEVRIYNQALTSAEIQKHYVQGLERHKFVQK